jgi:hypothetical protein
MMGMTQELKWTTRGGLTLILDPDFDDHVEMLAGLPIMERATLRAYLEQTLTALSEADRRASMAATRARLTPAERPGG